LLDEGAGFAGAKFAVHAAVFPFDGEGALVADAVQLADDLFEVDAAAAGAAEIPPATIVAEVEVAGENAGAAVERDDGVFDVHVIDAVGEGPQEFDGVDALPVEMAGVEIEAKFGAVVERFERPLSGVDIESNLGGMDFEGEFDAAFGEDVENRIEAIGKEFEAVVDHFAGDGREAVEQVPDRAAGKTVHDADAKSLSGAGRVLQLFGRPFIDAVGLAVAPDGRRKNGFVPLVDSVADGLADQMGADGVALQQIGRASCRERV